MKNRKKTQIEQDLLELEDYVESFWAFLPLAVSYLNPLHLILATNQGFAGLSGFKTNELIGRDLKVLFSDGEKVKKFKKEILERGEIKKKEMRLVTKDKKGIPVEISVLARRDKKGNIIGYFLSIIDISERKKFEEKLKREVERKTADLDEKIGELERMNKIMVGRELKMIELKEKINQLKNQLKSPE